MNVAYLLGGLVLAAIMFNGVWMLVRARPPIVRLGRHLPKAPAAHRWVGAAQIVGCGGVITEITLNDNVGGYIGGSGVGAMFLCYAAAWWVDYRARRRFQTDPLPHHAGL
jgi:hypothetical protein